MGTQDQWEHRISGNIGSMGTQDQWEHRINGNIGLVGTQDQWKHRISGNIGSMGTQDQWEHRISGNIGSVGTQDIGRFVKLVTHSISVFRLDIPIRNQRLCRKNIISQVPFRSSFLSCLVTITAKNCLEDKDLRILNFGRLPQQLTRAKLPFVRQR